MLDPQTEREEAVRRILDYTGQDAERTVTVADVAAARERDEPLVQVTAGTADEAAAAEEAGIDMVVCLGDAVAEVREGSPKLFVTAAIDFGGAITEDHLLGAAFDALVAGADAVITARGLRSVERLAHEEIPTMGHLGFVPKKSNLLGGAVPLGSLAPNQESNQEICLVEAESAGFGGTPPSRNTR
jgi:3-methyl-2-oxobutanoate hydroxymethyltransferase